MVLHELGVGAEQWDGAAGCGAANAGELVGFCGSGCVYRDRE